MSSQIIQFRVISPQDFRVMGMERISPGGIWQFHTVGSHKWTYGTFSSAYLRSRYAVLLDNKKNGIFEHDFVKFFKPAVPGKMKIKEEWIAEVVFNEQFADFGLRGGNTFVKNLIEPFSAYDEPEFDLLPFVEVIGNSIQNKEIYENPLYKNN